MKNSISRILYEECPEVLTDKDLSNAEANEELAALFNEELQLPLCPELACQLQEDRCLNNICDKIYNVLHPEEVVAGTLETEVLDETNILYKVDEIDTEALSNVLELHRIAKWHNVTKPITEDDDTLVISKVPYKEWLNTIIDPQGRHKVVEKRVQRGTEQHNQITWVVSDADTRDDLDWWLVDLNEDYYKSQTYIKEKKVLERSKQLLWEDWKAYHKRVALRDSALWADWIKYNNFVQDVFKDIKRHQSYIERIEKANFDSTRANIISNRNKRFDYYLWQFVDYQQKCIADNIEIKRTREDVEAKYPELTKKPTVPMFVPSWKKEQDAYRVSQPKTLAA